MNKRLAWAIVAAFILTAAIITGLVYGINTMTKPKETINVAFATSNIQAGSVLTPDLYEYKAIPVDEYLDTYVVKEEISVMNKDGEEEVQIVDILNGKETSENIYLGEAVIKDRVGMGTSSGDLLENTNLRKLTYTSEGVNNLAGQIKAGDRVDFWIRYTLQDKESNDNIICADKILSNVPVLSAYDSNSQSIQGGSEIPSSTIEVAITEEQLQDFILWNDLGKVTLAKVPVGSEISDLEITRKKLSMNDLILEVLSMDKDEMNKDDIVIDETQGDSVGNYDIINEDGVNPSTDNVINSQVEDEPNHGEWSNEN